MDMDSTSYFDVGTVLHNILFEGWNTNSWKDMVIASVIICTMTVIYEGLKTIKSYLIVRRKHHLLTNGDEDDNGIHATEGTSSQENLISSLRIPVGVEHVQIKKIILFLLESLLHMFNFLFGYILMLLIMTYSVWFLLAVVVGSGVGFLISHPLNQHFTFKFVAFKTQNTGSCHGGTTVHHVGSYTISAGINRP